MRNFLIFNGVKLNDVKLVISCSMIAEIIKNILNVDVIFTNRTLFITLGFWIFLILVFKVENFHVIRARLSLHKALIDRHNLNVIFFKLNDVNLFISWFNHVVLSKRILDVDNIFRCQHLFITLDL